jgi:HAD superfamily hydrolase (TIGR01484 family)
MTFAMLPLADLDRATASSARAVLTDIDDTLTDSGRLPATAYAALEALHEAGLLVVPVTGRPAGWCDLIARQWPVDGVVGENGALWFRYDHAARTMQRVYRRSTAERESDRARLNAVAGEVLSAVPGTAIAADQPFRVTDLAIDFREDVPQLSFEAAERVVQVFERHHATAKISSIHVNGWFGTHDKLTTSLSMLREVFGLDDEADLDHVIFVGDSPNDAPMFEHFPNAVGVANVRSFVHSMSVLPRFVTPSRGASGFAEFAAHLLALRAGQTVAAANEVR